MGKLSIPRLTIAIAIPAILLSSPTESFAAKSWLEKRLEKVFSAPQKQATKKRKQRRANTSVQSAGSIVLPATAPIPEFAVRDQASAQPPLPKDERAQKGMDAEAPDEVKLAHTEATDNASPSPPAPPVSEPAKDKAAPNDVELPDTAPAPAEVPVEARPEQPAVPDKGVPVPEEKPADAGVDPLETVPPEPPKPEFRPDRPDLEKPAEQAEPAEPPPPPDPRSAVRPDPSGKLPEEELACRSRLTDLGVKFKEAKAESDPSGCSMPYPIIVQSLGGGFELAPDAEMNCSTAEATARFTRDVISPTAKTVFGTTLRSISHASAYVCRPRNGTHKLSEHAFGNALDIAAFTLADGTVVAVELNPPEKHLLFLTNVRAAACGPFKTVLGPGSDADHAEHLHFDLAPRRHGGTVCE
ncbi:extensin family protein [Mesorhizobium sp. VNQ89]|uniref:extensin-like domain-containing protein n=1 Tax=Mesorhizobium quangtriensis TaxID=3157709 RepID=UPI0032B8646C